MHKLLNETRLSRAVNADHADLLLDHRLLALEFPGEKVALNDTLRFILARSDESDAASGRAVAIALCASWRDAMPVDSSHPATAAARPVASAAFVSSVPLGSVRP
jgi:hypothetical protein